MALGTSSEDGTEKTQIRPHPPANELHALRSELRELNARVTHREEADRQLEERLMLTEERLASLEPMAARVPAAEAKIQRMERLILELQGDMRRMERNALEYQQRLNERLDTIHELLLERLPAK